MAQNKVVFHRARVCFVGHERFTEVAETSGTAMRVLRKNYKTVDYPFESRQLLGWGMGDLLFIVA